MTFIASVIAKRGVAIIADSLVTSQMQILHYRDFLGYLENKAKEEPEKETIDLEEIKGLFNLQPIYTKDYEEKLFELNKYTAITTTGAAYINGKNISEIVHDLKVAHPDIAKWQLNIATHLETFSDYVTSQIREHLEKYQTMGYCLFYVTYYEISTYNTHIYKLEINEVDQETLKDATYNYITLSKEADIIKVVCDGQNKLSDNVLYGFGKTFYTKFPGIVRKIVEKLNLPEGTVPEDFMKTLIDDPYYNQMFFEDVEIFNLSDLSLQQAVDLASLLMRLEVDFQKYTKNMPTVGGVIKLAVIDEKEGFRFILGDKIEQPKHIHL